MAGERANAARPGGEVGWSEGSAKLLLKAPASAGITRWRRSSSRWRASSRQLAGTPWCATGSPSRVDSNPAMAGMSGIGGFAGAEPAVKPRPVRRPQAQVELAAGRRQTKPMRRPWHPATARHCGHRSIREQPAERTRPGGAPARPVPDVRTDGSPGTIGSHQIHRAAPRRRCISSGAKGTVAWKAGARGGASRSAGEPDSSPRRFAQQGMAFDRARDCRPTGVGVVLPDQQHRRGQTTRPEVVNRPRIFGIEDDQVRASGIVNHLVARAIRARQQKGRLNQRALARRKAHQGHSKSRRHRQRGGKQTDVRPESRTKLQRRKSLGRLPDTTGSARRAATEKAQIPRTIGGFRCNHASPRGLQAPRAPTEPLSRRYFSNLGWSRGIGSQALHPANQARMRDRSPRWLATIRSRRSGGERPRLHWISGTG
jgi:hypothetical protein